MVDEKSLMRSMLINPNTESLELEKDDQVWNDIETASFELFPSRVQRTDATSKEHHFFLRSGADWESFCRIW